MLHYTPLRLITLQLHYITLGSLHYMTLNRTTLHYTYNYNHNHNYNYATLHYTRLDYTTLRYPTLHYTRPIKPLQYNCKRTIFTNYSTPQLQLRRYITTTTTTTAARRHTTSSSCGWGDHCNHCHHSKKTQLQPPFSPSVDSPCHPWVTTTNLSYRSPIVKLPPLPCAVLLLCMSNHIMPYQIMPCHIISFHFISCHVISWHIISYHIIYSYHVISFHIMSFHTKPYPIVSCHIMSYIIFRISYMTYHIFITFSHKPARLTVTLINCRTQAEAGGKLGAASGAASGVFPFPLRWWSGNGRSPVRSAIWRIDGFSEFEWVFNISFHSDFDDFYLK